MTDHLDYDSLRADTVRQVAKLMAAAAITAPKSGGQLLLAGKHLFIETVIVDDRETLSRLAAWMRARGKERREAIWFRDAEAAEATDAVLFVGLSDWYPPVYDCGACGYATCAEFMQATSQLRRDSQELEFVGPQCNLRDCAERRLTSTPSLPRAPKPLPWVATGCRPACLSRFRPCPICDRLPPVASAWLHKCSMPVPPPELARPSVLPG
jgi:uncharacterized ferredoxin-like protein